MFVSRQGRLHLAFRQGRLHLALASPPTAKLRDELAPPHPVTAHRDRRRCKPDPPRLQSPELAVPLLLALYIEHLSGQ
jgi:hypothetical protein